MSDGSKLKRGARLELAYLHGGEVVCQPGEVLGPRELQDFELVYIIDGQVTYISDGAEYVVPPGGFIFGRPGFCETYRWDPKIPTRHAFFHFDISSVPEDWPDFSGWLRARSVLSPVGLGLFRHILQHIYEHDDWPAAVPAPRDCRLVEALLDTFLEEHIAESVSFERERPEAVRRALMVMRRMAEEQPLKPLSLTSLAAQSHVTQKHLCRLFERSLGCSPMQTFSRMKLQSARPLLMRTNLSVKEIAERCGFENQLYFSRRFSQIYGCSPSAFRKSLMGGAPVSLKNPLPVDLMPRARW